MLIFFSQLQHASFNSDKTQRNQQVSLQDVQRPDPRDQPAQEREAHQGRPQGRRPQRRAERAVQGHGEVEGPGPERAPQELQAGDIPEAQDAGSGHGQQGPHHPGSQDPPESEELARRAVPARDVGGGVRGPAR